MSRFFSLVLIRRFYWTVREEGLASAFEKARIYISLHRKGCAASVLKGTSKGADPKPNAKPETVLNGIWAEMARGNGFHAPILSTRQPRIALIGDLNLPQCRKYRVEQLAEFWEAQGVRCEYSHYQDIPRATRIMQQATHLCEYRLQASPLTHMLRYEARRLGLPVLYDIDDPLFSVSAYETYKNMEMLDPNLKAHFLSEAPKYAAMMNGADMVTVSTPGLATHAQLYTQRPVFVRRNFADAATLENGKKAIRAKRPKDGLFRVVFASGSQGHEADFDLIKDEITAFVTADSNRRLVILGHFNKGHLSPALTAQTEMHPFTTYDHYLVLLAQADVAVMPLQNDIFNQCKSAVRVIDAASVSVACIASDVGDLPALIDDVKTGFIARTSGDWTAALQMLADAPSKKSAMKKATRTALETSWSLQTGKHIIAPQILEWVKS